MALHKDIRQDDGVTTSYHRVLFIRLATNTRNTIGVVSYVDNEARESEKQKILIGPYRRTVTYELPYDATMGIEKAYAYIKTLPEFEGATDI